MAAAPDSLITQLLDELRPLVAQIGEIHAHRMSGGAALCYNDAVFALVSRGTFYLRVDSLTCKRFLVEKCTPFSREHNGCTISMMSYLNTPAETLDGKQPLRDWAQLTIGAVLRDANVKATEPEHATTETAKAPNVSKITETTAAKRAAIKKMPARKAAAKKAAKR